MNLPDTKNKKTIVENDSLEKLEHDVKSALNKMGTHGVSDAKYEPSYFDARYRVLEKHIKGRQKDIAKIFEQRLEQLKTCLKKESYLVKHIICWSLLALFLFCADINIGSLDAQQNFGTVFGIAILGLDKHEIMVGSLILLIILYIHWMWVRLKISIAFTDVYVLARSAIERELVSHREIYKCLIEHAMGEKMCQQFVNFYNIEGRLHSLAKNISSRDAILKLEKIIRFFATFLLTIATVAIVSSQIEKHYSLSFDLVLYIGVVLIVLLLITIFILKYIKRKLK